MSPKRMTQHKLGVKWVYTQVEDYCDARANRIGGAFHQRGYKLEFFNIFKEAYYGHFCGAMSNKYYDTAFRNHREVAFEDVVINNELLSEYLSRKWLTRNRRKDNAKMVEVLCQWWDAWTVAWDNYPGKLWSPRRERAMVYAKVTKWSDTHASKE